MPNLLKIVILKKLLSRARAFTGAYWIGHGNCLQFHFYFEKLRVATCHWKTCELLPTHVSCLQKIEGVNRELMNPHFHHTHVHIDYFGDGR